MIAQDELAMVQESVSNPMIGKMRMQFWRDAVKGMSDVRTSCWIRGSGVYNFVVGQTATPPDRVGAV